MTSSRFSIRQQLPSAATRPNGVAARQGVVYLLDAYDLVEIDFDGVIVTPSFADELVGQLFESLGEQTFRARIKLVGVSPEVRPLLNHVIAKHRPRI